MSEPGLTEPGMSERGMSEPGMSEPGLTERGLTEPGMSERGLTEPGMSEPGLTERGLTGREGPQRERGPTSAAGAVAGIVVPAHDEQAVLGQLLARLTESARPGELEVVVVANGCTDGTAALARSFSPAVRVVETAIAGKRAALRLGDEAVTAYPRLYVDADVELGTEDVRRLCAALAEPGVLAAAPARRFDMRGRSWPVRWYYDVWTRLPEVRDGLFGRGVLALSEAGHRSVAALPAVMADDLAVSLAFGPAERTVVPGATVLIRPPRGWRDLLRRRVRAQVGTVQIEQDAVRPDASARTSVRDLLGLARREPLLAIRIPLFLAVAVLARTTARRAVRAGDFTTWLRDESSRQG